MTVRAKYDIEADAEVRQIDLSGVPPAEGKRLRVRLPGIGVSLPTAGSQAGALQTFYTVARGLSQIAGERNLTRQRTPRSRPPDYHHVYTAELSDFTQLFPANTPRIGERRPHRRLPRRRRFRNNGPPAPLSRSC